MAYQVSTEWTGNEIAFTSNIDGHTVNLDSNGAEAPIGASPKQLLVLSVIGCTAMDVVSLMAKMRVPFTAFSIDGYAPVTEEHPKVFEYINLTYKVTGKDINRDKVVKAIELSMTKYCGVSIMLKKHCPVNWELEIIDA